MAFKIIAIHQFSILLLYALLILRLHYYLQLEKHSGNDDFIFNVK